MPDTPPTPAARPDAALLALRPAVPAATAAAGSGTASTVGDFLHGTLRPVLKLQNGLLLALVADFILDHHVPLAKAEPTEQRRLLTELLGRNTKLRYTLLGLLTGAFTAAEYAFYRAHRAELNRRLLDLARERVLSQLSAVVELLARPTS